MIKRWLILVFLALSALVTACTPAVDDAVGVAENGRLVTVFRAPT